MTDRTDARPAIAAPLWILAVIAALFLLREARALAIPIALGVLISYAFEPVVAWLERRRVPRWAGGALVLLAIAGACAAGAYSLTDDVMQVVEMAPKALERAREAIVSKLGIHVGAFKSAASGLGMSAVGESGATQAALPLVQQGAAAVLGLAGHLVVIFFLIYFLLVSGRHVRNRLVEVTGPDPERRRTTATIIDDINTQIQRYLLVLVVTAIIVGVATWAVLAWMGVQHAAMWGILAGVFNSIPYFGPVIVCGGLFTVGMVQGGGIAQAFQLSGAALLITSLEGWLITPPLMGKAEGMSALAVFLGLLLWTWVWGGWGTVLAVPMLVVIKSVADHVERLKPLGRLMAP